MHGDSPIVKLLNATRPPIQTKFPLSTPRLSKICSTVLSNRVLYSALIAEDCFPVMYYCLYLESPTPVSSAQCAVCAGQS